MALKWLYQDSNSGRRYEVRSAGATLRLYTNGAFHSQYNPRRVLTGGVWDLLAIAGLFGIDSAQSKSLMLGVGGGAAIHLLNKLIDQLQLDGIEFDPIHLQVAREYFDITGDNLDLIEADAHRWVRQSKRTYDLVIDDLFVDGASDPERPFAVDASWMSQLNRKVRKHGCLVQNHLSRASAIKAANVARSQYATALLFTIDHYENVVLGLYRDPIATRQRSQQVRQHIKSRLGKSATFTVRQYF